MDTEPRYNGIKYLLNDFVSIMPFAGLPSLCSKIVICFFFSYVSKFADDCRHLQITSINHSFIISQT